MWIELATDVVSSDPSQPIVVALISALGGVVAAAFAALVSLARRETREPPLSATPSLGERVAVLERRADDSDDQLELQDRRLDREERRMEDGLRRLRRLEGIDDDHNPAERRD